MTNQGSSQWNPDQTYSTDPDIGQTQQFGVVPQQQYGRPDEYPTSYQPEQPEKRGDPSPWLYVLGALLLVAVVGVLAFMGGSGAFSRSSEPVTSTVVETHTLPRSEASEQPSKGPTKRTYSHYAPATDVTTAGFATNVYEAFQESYGRTGTADMTVSVYSPATGITYRMTCSGGETVYCTGGKNARVKIW